MPARRVVQRARLDEGLTELEVLRRSDAWKSTFELVKKVARPSQTRATMRLINRKPRRLTASCKHICC